MLQDDLIRPFQVERAGVRGRLARLGPSLDRILQQHDYPKPVAALLGEAIALATLLAAALKFEGVFSLQAKGDGAVRLLVADVATPGTIRGYAQFDAASLERLAGEPGGSERPLPRLMGGGYLAFTVDQGEDTERYQGIVPLEGATLGECAHKYFRDSEQIDAAIRLAAAQVDDGAGGTSWRAGGLMVQRLPEGDPAMLARGVEYDREAWEENWRRAVILLASARPEELVDAELTPDALLYRLYHEEGIRVFRDQGLAFGCRCSAERAEWVLRSLSEEAIRDLSLDGRLIVDCEFCSARYDFAAAQFIKCG
jgi:molecular chaperone Hsp33